LQNAITASNHQQKLPRFSSLNVAKHLNIVLHRFMNALFMQRAIGPGSSSQKF